MKGVEGMLDIAEIRINHLKEPKGIAGNISVGWKIASGHRNVMQERYQIQISEKKDFTKGTRAKNFKASNTKAAAEGLKSGKKYYVRIRGYKNYQGKRIYGEWSKEKSVKVR